MPVKQATWCLADIYAYAIQGLGYQSNINYQDINKFSLNLNCNKTMILQLVSCRTF